MGRVIGAYGVRGWIRVKPFTGTPDALIEYGQWWLTGSSRRVIDARMHGGVPVARLEGIETREQAEALIGNDVAVPRDALPETADDEVYWSDLVGCEVVNRKGETLGRVADVQDMAGQALLRVVADAGEGDRVVERLIPCVPAYVREIDLEANRIDVDWDADY